MLQLAATSSFSTSDYRIFLAFDRAEAGEVCCVGFRAAVRNPTAFSCFSLSNELRLRSSC